MKTLNRNIVRHNSPPNEKTFLITPKNPFMKLFLTIFAITFLSLHSKAQLEKHTWLVGGSGSFYLSKRNYTSYLNSSTDGYSNELNLTISPNVGYFVTDKLVLGLRPYFSWGKGESFSSIGDPLTTSDSKRYGIGPFGRYYFLNKDKPFNILTEINYQIGVWDLGEKGKLSNFSFLAGPVIYFNTSVGMEFLLGYSTQSEELKNFSKNSSKGFSVNIGFQIHLIK